MKNTMMFTQAQFWHRVAIAGLLCAVATAKAQQTQSGVTAVPRLMHFAGSFHPPANQPAGPVGATFAIFGAQDGGTPLWSEDQNVSLDANGSYTVLLGSTKNEGVPMELFSAGEARWLQVKFHLPDEVSQPRVLLVSVPYALKAADAETIGGLPPSAFVLAAPTASGETGTPGGRDAMASASAMPAVTGTGTADFLPRWTNSTGTLGNSVLFQSGTGSTAEVGINTTTPATTLDVNGTATLRGTTTMAAIGTASASGGKRSEPFDMTGSAFNSGTSSAIAQTFRLQTEAAGNDTSTPSATLNLLYAAGAGTPGETGLKIASNGQIEFAPGQTFPGGGGGGTVTSVGSGPGLTGGPITGSGTLSVATGGVSNAMLANPSLTVTAGTGLTGGGAVALGANTTLNLDTTKVPLLNTANTFTGSQTVNGNLSATGVVTGSSFQIGSNLFGFGSYTNQNALLGFSGNGGVTGTGNTGTGVTALTYNGSGSDNTATGAGTLYFNNGNGNTANGFEALYNNSTGTYNTGIGYQALFYNNGSDNTATGTSALLYNNSGYGNTADGFGALGDTTTGFYNTAVGLSALAGNTTGYENTAVGYYAGTTVPAQLAGTLNTFVGFKATVGTENQLNNATAIGANATVSESSALILGGTAGNAVSVGIGTATPFNDYALDVEATGGGAINGGVVSNANGGNIYLGMTDGVHKFRVDTNGVAYADGGFQSSGADFAESFAVRGQRSLYEPGDVLEIDRNSDRHLTLSHHPYATLVAGIYSTKPGVLASPHHIDDPAVQKTEVPLAVVGIVPCKVSTENGAIARGDLLVTSSRPGYAMKGTNRRRMLGAVVGKALEPLPNGTGVIQVLVTLQ
jgi:hypothetical protein